MQVERITGAPGVVVTNGPKPLRYALYVYARQHPGAWLKLMGLEAGPSEAGTAKTDTAQSPEPGEAGDGFSRALRSPAHWSLSADDIAQLPPLFITASSGDEDVPLRISKTLARTAPRAKSSWVYYLPHDFDRDTSDPAGARVYEQAIGWMNALV